MTTNESQTKHPEWAAFVQYLLQAHTVHDLARAAEVHDCQVDQWLTGCPPAEWQIEVMARSFDWSVIRHLRALDAAGYLAAPRIPRKNPTPESESTECDYALRNSA